MSEQQQQRTDFRIQADVGELIASRTKRLCRQYAIGSTGKSFAYDIEQSNQVYVDRGAMSARAVISTATVDRVGDVLIPSGCNLKNYAKNPVVLWGHGIEGLAMPIATSSDPQGNLAIQINEDEVIGTSYFSQSLLESRQIFELIDEGIVRATSVRETPLKSRLVMRDGEQVLLVDEWELEEWSWCAIGVNPDAVAKKLDKNKLDGKPIVASIKKSLLAVAPQIKKHGIGMSISTMKGWITLKPHGKEEDSYVHVFIGDNGHITHGPSGMVGKKPSELSSAHHESHDSSDTHDPASEHHDSVTTHHENVSEQSHPSHPHEQKVSKDDGLKPWIAKISGKHPKFGLERNFVPSSSRDLSRSGRTGTHTYHIHEPGLYEVGGTKRENHKFVLTSKNNGQEWHKEHVDDARAHAIAQLMDNGESFHNAHSMTQKKSYAGRKSMAAEDEKKPANETPADESDKGTRDDSAAQDSGEQPYSQKSIISAHSKLGGVCKSIKKSMGKSGRLVEHPEANSGLLSVHDACKDQMTALEGLHAKCYPGSSALKSDDGMDSESDGDSDDSEMKAFFAEQSVKHLQLDGIVASLKSLAEEKGLTTSQKNRLVVLAGGLGRLSSAAKSYKPKQPQTVKIDEEQLQLLNERLAKLNA